MTSPTDLRVGLGFDVHPWSEDPARPLVLGGVSFPDHAGLTGHSDADAIAHACTDAIVGAAGLGDIGVLFPDTAAEHAGADSVDLLRRATAEVNAAGWTVVNIDCTVVLDSPKIGPHRDEMQKRLSAAAGGAVTVKGKRTEGVDGLQGGVQCQAVALLVRSTEPNARAHSSTEHSSTEHSSTERSSTDPDAPGDTATGARS